MENNMIRLIHLGTGGQKGWIYSTNGIMATLTSSQYKDPPKVVVKCRKIK